MKVHLRDRITALVGIVLLAILAATSYYYSLISDVSTLKNPVHRESPDFITRDIVITEFEKDGRAKRRFFADYAEHYSDGRMSSIRPRMVTLLADEPQVKASADTGSSMDDGESFVFTGNVRVTRAGDREHAPLKFKTTHVTVYPDTNILETDAPVEMTSGSDITTGTGLTLDNVDRTVKIHHNVRTITLPKNNETARHE